ATDRYRYPNTVIQDARVVITGGGWAGPGDDGFTSTTGTNTVTLKGIGSFNIAGDYNTGDQSGTPLGVTTMQDQSQIVSNTFSVGKFGSANGVVVMNGGTVTVNGGDSRVGGAGGTG